MMNNSLSLKLSQKFTIMADNRLTPYQKLTHSQSLYGVDYLPHVPVPLEEIKAYTKLRDYAKDRIKNINTVGILKPVNGLEAELVSTRVDRKAKIKLDISKFSDRAFTESVWKAVRAFGTLESRDKETVLVIDNCLPVMDAERCERILRLSAQIAPQRISFYRYEPMTKPDIRRQIKILKDLEFFKRVADPSEFFDATTKEDENEKLRNSETDDEEISLSSPSRY